MTESVADLPSARGPRPRYSLAPPPGSGASAGTSRASARSPKHLRPGGRRLEEPANAQIQRRQGNARRCVDQVVHAVLLALRGLRGQHDGLAGDEAKLDTHVETDCVDYGAVRDFGQSDPASKFVGAGNGPLLQIPGTGVIWKICNTAEAEEGQD